MVLKTIWPMLKMMLRGVTIKFDCDTAELVVTKDGKEERIKFTDIEKVINEPKQ